MDNQVKERMYSAEELSSELNRAMEADSNVMREAAVKISRLADGLKVVRITSDRYALDEYKEAANSLLYILEDYGREIETYLRDNISVGSVSELVGEVY